MRCNITQFFSGGKSPVIPADLGKNMPSDHVRSLSYDVTTKNAPHFVLKMRTLKSERGMQLINPLPVLGSVFYADSKNRVHFFYQAKFLTHALW